MTMPLPAPRPWARAAGFAAASVGFAVAAHTSADGSLPRIGVVALALLAVAALSRPLARVERHGAGLFAALVGIQLALHTVFVAAAGRASTTAAGWLCCGASASPASAVSPASASATHAATTVGAAQPGLLSHAALVQLLMHLVAAAALAVALRLSEQSLWRPVRAAALAVQRQVTAAVVSLLAALADLARITAWSASAGLLPRRSRDWPTTAPLSPGLAVVRITPRRGPPRGAFATA